MMKRAKCGVVAILAFLLMASLSAVGQTYITHDFNDGTFGPYEVNKADQQSRVYIMNNAVETHWDQTLYNGTNSGRKAQFRPINDIIFTQHIWMGLRIKIHNDYMAQNTNTHAGLMQIWGYNGQTGAANHMCMLKFDGRNGGALVWQHRYNSVANKTHILVEPNFPREQFVDVIVHVKLAEYNKGTVQIWVDGVLKVDVNNQTIGWGEMDSSGMINGTHCFGTSLGQYNYLENAGYDDAYDGTNIWFDGHMAGETRTVTYDNVSLYNGADGYNMVDPAQTSSPPAPCTSTNIALCGTAAQSSTGYGGDAARAIDGNTNGAWSGNSVTHTNNEANPWWEVTLTDTYTIDDINIFNRTDNCCKARLSNFTVSVLDGSTTTFSQSFTTYPDPSQAITVGGAVGNKVRVQLNDTNPLSLAEVEVFGSTVSCPSFSTVQAESFNSMSGIVDEGTNIGYIHDGDWAMYSNIDLSCATDFEVRASSQTSGGNMEIRTGSPTGTLLGTVSIPGTGSWGNYSNFSTTISGASGVQDVYLVFTGGSGYLFNVDWFKFSDGSGARRAESIADTKATQLQVYPNPVRDQLKVDLGTGGFQQYVVYDLNGKAVRSGAIASDRQHLEIDVEDLHQGIYLLHVIGKTSNQQLKIIKQ
ncbi:carbohydrate-binding protein [Marinoscillum furvescens]|uniref:Putative secreted protein (Por secretion system target) n=1 Tax=Marinoscillum furvescens DSM 4134 TaxID=1122208 RepID=A0A3D9KYJ1_MARFU|nr:carbohydrate-binding protein [Marinoscillum furvescens]RED94649.1 putative secreted protein (Por secretion system target) [Marinoscillum furvescens DSM 4134]